MAETMMATATTKEPFTTEEMEALIGGDSYDALGSLLLLLERTEATLNRTSFDNSENVLLLQVLSKASQCQTNGDEVIILLSSVKESIFFKVSLGYLLMTNDVDELCMVIRDWVELASQLSIKIPSAVSEMHVTMCVIKNKLLEILPKLDNNVRENMHRTLDIIINLQDMAVERSITKTEATNPKFTKKPPDDFRKISVLPRMHDIFLNSRVFLRANKSRGNFENLQHYLDVQFRLYREDCISPLREGIVEYVCARNAGRYVRKLQNGRLYEKVMAVKSESSIEGELVVLQIDDSYASKIRWKTSDRLLYGSLVCLSKDNFQTMHFAVVAESDRDQLADEHHFKVRFPSESFNSICQMHFPLTMVESTAYYEAYRHVLSTLQNIKDGDLPFEKFLVHCQNQVEAPKYLLEKPITYDFQPIVSNGVICKQNTRYTLFGFRRNREDAQQKPLKVNLFSEKWPNPQELHLDESQFSAFKSALTEEFVLIQGPPGTGKTHVGLQIAKTLLHNESVWSKRTSVTNVAGRRQRYEVNSPMLIVCFTNHALDQFMEGVIRFHDDKNAEWKQGIVRVGGRCNNELVEQFSLKYRRSQYHKVDKGRYFKLIQAIRPKISRYSFHLKQAKTVILNYEILRDVMTSEQYEWFKKKGECKQGDTIMANWLSASETDLTKRANKRFRNKTRKAKNKQKPTRREDDVTHNSVNVKTDAEKAEEERKIEDDFVDEEFDEDIGLDVKRLINTILSEYDENDVDEEYKKVVQEEAQTILNKLASPYKMTDEQANRGISLHKLSNEDRWSLYRYWVDCHRKELEKLDAAQKSICMDYEKEKQEVDALILKKSKIIAMTTTSAARYHNILQDVGPRIVIVEEAAEILEAHIVTTLSSKCEHLILIGDHKQLEPKPAVYELAVRYNLGISMFERMLNNGLSFHCLQRQHRMRPEISTLVRHIYPVLIDNDNVMQYDHIGGVKKDVFFINHHFLEEKRDDTRSFTNEHEAHYIMRLCRYLMLQGYEATQITILAAYNGQMFCIRNLMPKSDFFGVRVCAIDNYQGEENDIILLSLTRSNKDGNIGFLKKENRICVALSRAKKGLYAIGNFDILEKGSSLWRKILHDVRASEGINGALPIYCQIHPEKVTMVRSPDDFDNAPKGGCKVDCDFQLPCGHACRFKCHPIDKEHKDYQCEEICNKICPNGHVCKKICHHEVECFCGEVVEKALPCGHFCKMLCWKDPAQQKCKVLVQRKLEKCDHEVELECYIDPKKYKCGVIVTKTLPCDHNADIQCHQDPSIHDCKTTILKKRSCGHSSELECWRCQKGMLGDCHELVMRERSCGHLYQIECFKDYIAYENKHLCKTVTTKTFPLCGHSVDMECCVNINSISCNTIISKKLDCGHTIHTECHKQNVAECELQCLKKCSDGHICTKRCHYGSVCNCEELVEKTLPLCGHKQLMPCHKNEYLESCKTKVWKILPKCKHKFKMECGKDPYGEECQETVLKIVPKCGHLNEMLCSMNPNLFDKCSKMLSKTLPCEHKMTMKCCADLSSVKCKEITRKRLPSCKHFVEMLCYDNDFSKITCSSIVEKTLPNCIHTKLVECSEDISHLICNEKVTITLQCGHKCEILCCNKPVVFYEDGTIDVSQFPKCSEQIKVTLPCKHTVNVECCQQDSAICTATCGVDLCCGHACNGSCKDCFRFVSHPICKKSCERELICGHSCSSSACILCRPCDKICGNCCPHSACDLVCGLPCKPCYKPCTWTCPHYACSKLCEEECDRPRCIERCPKKLACSHQCMGFCGEPCPNICGECNPGELAMVIKDRDIQSKECLIVYLQGCGHEFLAEKLDNILDNLDKTSIKVARCPSCRSIIYWHPRYGNILKRIKSSQNQIKTKTLVVERNENREMKFPVIGPNFDELGAFWKQCNTDVFPQQRLLTNDKSSLQHHCHAILTLIDNLQRFLNGVDRHTVCEQTLHDLYNSTYKLAAHWMTFIALSYLEDMKNLESEVSDDEDENMNTSKENDTGITIDSRTNKSDNTTNMQAKKHQNQYVMEMKIKEAESVLEISQKFTLNKLMQVESLIKQSVVDIDRLEVATNYPVFEGVLSVHTSDWNKCLEGHLTPSSCHRTGCIKCEMDREPDAEMFIKDLHKWETFEENMKKEKKKRKVKDNKKRKRQANENKKSESSGTKNNRNKSRDYDSPIEAMPQAQVAKPNIRTKNIEEKEPQRAKLEETQRNKEESTFSQAQPWRPKPLKGSWRERERQKAETLGTHTSLSTVEPSGDSRNWRGHKGSNSNDNKRQNWRGTTNRNSSNWRVKDTNEEKRTERDTRSNWRNRDKRNPQEEQSQDSWRKQGKKSD